jgi:hypothetical protein
MCSVVTTDAPDTSVSALADSSVGVIDPLFLHFFGVGEVFDKTVDEELLLRQLESTWGILSEFQSRLSENCSKDCISTLLFPALVDGDWTVSIVQLIPNSNSTNSFEMCTLVSGKQFKPTTSQSTSKVENLTELVARIVGAVLGRFSKRTALVPKYISHVLVSKDLPTKQHSSDAFRIIHVLHVALHDMKTRLANSNSEKLSMILKDTRKDDIASIRKKFLGYIINDGKQAYNKRKEYVTFMSQSKFS